MQYEHHDDATYELSTSPGSFMHGFTLGVIAGATGYFLFATEKGTKLRQQLVGEWQEAKKKLVEEGVVEHPDMSLRQFLYSLFHKVTGAGSAITPKTRTPAPPVSTGLLAENAAKSARAKKDSSPRFKGV